MAEQGVFATDPRIPRPTKILRREGLKIKVFSGVFYPREETFFWVKRAFSLWKKERSKKQRFYGLDIFCGTGVLGIYFLKREPYLKLVFSDISLLALHNTSLNLKENKLSDRGRVLYSNLFSSLLTHRLDLVLANPPYVAQERLEELDSEVLASDPWQSWFGGEEGLETTLLFLKELPFLLTEQGCVFIELDPLQFPYILEHSPDLWKKKVLFDQFGKPRVLFLKRT